MHKCKNVCKNVCKPYICKHALTWKNVDKKCAFSFLVSIFDHLYVVYDKSKTILTCGTASYNTSCCMGGIISHSSTTLVW